MTSSVLDVEAAGRRERKKRTTFLALRAAALDLVSERGFCNVTVEDIAEAVDVSVRTFFNYFSSKEEALVGDDASSREAMREELLALPGDVQPLDALRRVLVGRLGRIAEDLDISGEDHEVWRRRFVAVHAQPEVAVAYAKQLTVLEQLLAGALLERLGGEPRLGEYAALVTAASLAVMRAAGAKLGEDARIEELIDRSNAAFELMANGFAPPPASAGRAGRSKR